VFTSTDSYDPRAVDIWSLAIIYCCMYLKRFPWKCPKMTDSSFKQYSMPDDQPHDYAKAAVVHNELIRKRKEERKRLRELENLKSLTLKDETSQSLNEEPDKTKPNHETEAHPQRPKLSSQKLSSSAKVPTSGTLQKFHGPYRLMRLLPHSSRPILSRMLTIDVTQRASMSDILNDSWYQEICMCTLDAKEKYVGCVNHVHTKLEDDASSHLDFYKAGQ
ncbi:hypothetical protein WICPIJ_003558, partial [Wickerhamomyces pijperi]